MVFPQGCFSTAALAALRDTGFVAAVNSTLFPVDAAQGALRLRHLLAPAYTATEDFAVFLRRYPDEPVICAMDLYLGRPLLVVEHHEYFADDYHACRQFIEAVNGFSPAVTWAPLDQTVLHAFLQRQLASGAMEVKLFGSRALVHNSADKPIRYRFVRAFAAPASVRRVLINAAPVAHEITDEGIAFSCELPPGSSADVEIEQSRGRDAEPFRGSAVYGTRVWVRRKLCDARDNSPAAAAAFRSVKRLARKATAA
jgi:hypothetical protein